MIKSQLCDYNDDELWEQLPAVNVGGNYWALWQSLECHWEILGIGGLAEKLYAVWVILCPDFTGPWGRMVLPISSRGCPVETSASFGRLFTLKLKLSLPFVKVSLAKRLQWKWYNLSLAQWACCLFPLRISSGNCFTATCDVQGRL